ncbi:MAG: hypothetical protein OXI16_02420 [Chloroflexota bacterium]|nr:hypothetical protein [Chloroflexota bacterium]
MSAPKRFASLPRILVAGIAIALLALAASASWAPPAHAIIAELLVRDVEAHSTATTATLSWLPPRASTSSYDHDNDATTPAIELTPTATVARYELIFDSGDLETISPLSDRNARVETMVTGLQPGMQYAFTLRSCDSSSCGPVEKHRYVWTAPAAPFLQVRKVRNSPDSPGKVDVDMVWVSSYNEDIRRPDNFDLFVCLLAKYPGNPSQDCPGYTNDRQRPYQHRSLWQFTRWLDR